MNPIDTTFRNLRAAKRRAFVPFISAGDPDIAATGRIVRELDGCGCDLIEIGFPFSDPIADGPVIQAAYTRALERGLKIADVFTCVDGLKNTVQAPLLGMTSYSLIHRRGPAEFLDRAQLAGFAGLIVPDLPAEEAETFAGQTSQRDLKLVMLVTPTTPPERAERIVKISAGFVYCVSVAGITGERDRLPDELLGQLRRLRSMTDLPLCVGFGVSKPDHVRMLRDHADGVIVGSAIVRRLEKATPQNWDATVGDIRELVQSLISALNPIGR
jgi:tryptophan synthase alpha chain